MGNVPKILEKIPAVIQNMWISPWRLTSLFDKGGNMGASVSYGHISSFILKHFVFKFTAREYRVPTCDSKP